MNKIKYILFLLLIIHIGRSMGQAAQRYDIIISEIMADPTPNIGLPAVEYIELHNRQPQKFLLHNWTLKLGNTMKPLPDIEIDSNGYVVIIADKNKELFSPYCSNFITLSSLSITDGGQSIVLSDKDGYVIHYVSFKNNWHSEPVKREGGWSLEMIDEDLPCHGKDNWSSSCADIGGTPGKPNSIGRATGDFNAPNLERVTLLNDSTVRLFFSESIRPTEPTSSSLVSISPHVEIQRITEVPPDFSALDLHLSEAIHPNVQYLASVSENLCDCAQNFMTAESLLFGIPSQPVAGDIIINEVLSHPYDGTDADFIEIYNNSSKIIDLKDIKIGSGGDELPLKAICAVSSGRQLMPQGYCALCKDKEHTSSHYYCQNAALQQNDSLPAFANDNGVIFLSTSGLQTLDKFIYSVDMHYSGLTSTEGVSLERLDADRPTQDETNWHSAAFTAGFATPGYKNSQTATGTGIDDIAFYPEVFSPNNDGFEDFTELALHFSDIENRTTIQIFNHTGNSVKHLANNEPCGNEAFYRWDGTDDNGNLLPSGSYIAVIHWWNANGKNKRVQKVISIFDRDKR